MEKKYKNAFATLLKLFSFFKGYELLLVIVGILIIYTSFANIFGTYMLKDVIANGITAGNYNYLLRSASILGLIYFLGAMSDLAYTQIMIKLSQRVIYRLREKLNKKVLSLPLSYFDQHQVGEIMNFFTSDIDSTINALNQSFANILFSCCNAVGTMLGMYLIDWRLALIATFIIIITVIFIAINSVECRKYFRRQQETLSIINGCVEEDLRGIKVNKAFEHEDQSYQVFEKKNADWRDATTKAFFHTQLNTPFIVSLSYLNFAICAIVGIIFIANGMLPGGIAALTPFVMYVRTSAQPFNFFTIHFNTILNCLAGAERIFAFYETEEENVNDKGHVKLVKINDTYYREKGPNDHILLEGDIIFDHVVFGYNKEKIILNDISFYAHKGQKLAFVGSTGAGKTTIISLISRFYEINSGTITYDGINIQDIKIESLRRAMSMVTQETHLFSDSILNNIKYPRMHSTFEEVQKASDIAGASHFISKLKDGYNTLLYDDGANLSEGERQLLSLARAAISHPPLLILDEATSNIDTRTEKIVEKTMDTLMQNKTVLVIAHRLSTVRNSTAILVLEHGKIIERGSHDELLALKGKYYALYKGIEELS